MNCPHCRRSLQYKQRANRRCGHCRREFALEPREDMFRLSDTRLEKLVAEVSSGRRYYYTTEQLYFAAARKTLKTGKVRRYLRRNKPIHIKEHPRAFRQLVVSRMTRVYGGPPPGLIVEPPRWEPRQPRTTVFCTDPSVLVCIAANGLAERHELILASHVTQVPLGLPVVVLHDASIAGVQLAAAARAQFRGAVVAALRPCAHTMGRIRLRDVPPPAELMAQITDLDVFDRRELAWLAAGHRTPIAAVKPEYLIDIVERGVSRAQQRADPETWQAERVGFVGGRFG